MSNFKPYLASFLAGRMKEEEYIAFMVNQQLTLSLKTDDQDVVLTDHFCGLQLRYGLDLRTTYATGLLDRYGAIKLVMFFTTREQHREVHMLFLPTGYSNNVPNLPCRVEDNSAIDNHDILDFMVMYGRICDDSRRRTFPEWSPNQAIIVEKLSWPYHDEPIGTHDRTHKERILAILDIIKHHMGTFWFEKNARDRPEEEIIYQAPDNHDWLDKFLMDPK